MKRQFGNLSMSREIGRLSALIQFRSRCSDLFLERVDSVLDLGLLEFGIVDDGFDADVGRLEGGAHDGDRH